MQEINAMTKLAIPLIITALAMMGMEIIDTLMIGRLGPIALAAAALGGAAFVALLFVCMGIMAAVGSLISNAKGRGDEVDLRLSLQQGFWLALLITLPLTAIIYLMPYALAAMGQDDNLLHYTASYLHMVVWGFFPALVFVILREFVALMNQAKIIMLIALLAMPLNALFNYLFMYGKFGFPHMGVAGAGFATSLIQWLMMLSLLLYILKNPTLQQFQICKNFGLANFAKIKEIFRLGWPIGCLFGFEVGMFAITTMLMGLLGTYELAAHQITLQCTSLIFMFPMGIAQATAIRVGVGSGARDYVAMRRSAHAGVILGLLIAGITATFFTFFADEIIKLFVGGHSNVNAEVYQYALKFLLIAAVFQFCDAIQVISNGALRGIRDTKIPMLIGLCTYWGIGLSSGTLLAFIFAYHGVGLWWGLALGIASSALFLLLRFHLKLIALQHSKIQDKNLRTHDLLSNCV